MLLSGDDIADLLDSTIHDDTQSGTLQYDLTVQDVYELNAPGKLDFGGGEFARAGRQRIAPEKQSPDDDYGWWVLAEGEYIIRFNEVSNLDDGQAGLVCSHERLVQAGGSIPTTLAPSGDDEWETLLRVGRSGLHIKENSRVASLVVIEP